MSDYTPTTEEVRDAFSDYKEDDAGGWFKAQAGFDRWLAKHDAEVAKAERERVLREVWSVSPDGPFVAEIVELHLSRERTNE